MKIRPVGAEVFHTDRQSEMTKLIAVFRNFANAPNNEPRFTVENMCIFLRVGTQFIKSFSRNELFKELIVVQLGHLINYCPTCKVNRVVIFSILLWFWRYPFHILSRKFTELVDI